MPTRRLRGVVLATLTIAASVVLLAPGPALAGDTVAVYLTGNNGKTHLTRQHPALCHPAGMATVWLTAPVCAGCRRVAQQHLTPTGLERTRTRAATRSIRLSPG